MANIFPAYFYSASCEEPALVTSHYTSCMHQFISAASVLAAFPFSLPFLLSISYSVCTWCTTMEIFCGGAIALMVPMLLSETSKWHHYR